MSMLTTTDNPFDPHTQWREWYAWDFRAGYNTPGLLARMVEEMAGEDDPDDETIEAAIERIVALNASGVHRKVTQTDDEDEDLETEDESEEEPDDLDDEEDEADKVDDAEWEEILAELRGAGIDLDNDNLSRADRTGNNFERFWTRGKGLARWRLHPHPWRRLRSLLRKHPRIRDPEGLASTYFRRVFGYWPGHRKGSNPVGPG